MSVPIQVQVRQIHLLHLTQIVHMFRRAVVRSTLMVLVGIVVVVVVVVIVVVMVQPVQLVHLVP
jgi:hypothetical protein